MGSDALLANTLICCLRISPHFNSRQIYSLCKNNVNIYSSLCDAGLTFLINIVTYSVTKESWWKWELGVNGRYIFQPLIPTENSVYLNETLRGCMRVFNCIQRGDMRGAETGDRRRVERWFAASDPLASFSQLSYVSLLLVAQFSRALSSERGCALPFAGISEYGLIQWQPPSAEESHKFWYSCWSRHHQIIGATVVHVAAMWRSHTTGNNNDTTAINWHPSTCQTLKLNM